MKNLFMDYDKIVERFGFLAIALMAANNDRM